MPAVRAALAKVFFTQTEFMTQTVPGPNFRKISQNREFNEVEKSGTTLSARKINFLCEDVVGSSMRAKFMYGLRQTKHEHRTIA